MIVVLTGSRDLKPSTEANLAIFRAMRDAKHVHLGDCPTGLDRLALVEADRMGASFTVHVADWDAFGRSAGPKRNARMVESAALMAERLGLEAVCYAWPRGASRGTRDCMRRAAAAGMRVEER